MLSTFTRAFIPQNAKLWQQNEFTTKHQMFSYKFYPNPENFTPSRMVGMVTFSKSGNTVPQLLWFGIDCVLKPMNERLTEWINEIIN